MIYIIGTGYYSDWNIVGYMEDGNEAANYVAMMNNKIQNDWDKYWFIEGEKLTAEMEKKEWWVRHTYRIIEWDNGNKSECHYPNETYTIDEDNFLTDKYEEPKYEVTKLKNRIERQLTMTIRANISMEKALKICRDEMARQRAEREGL